MKTHNVQIITDELRDLTNWIVQIAEQKLANLTPEQVRQRPANGGWSVGECLVHLNFYGNFYLPESLSAIQKTPSAPTPQYRSSWLGNWFTDKIRVKPDGSVFKMKAPKNANPQRMEVPADIVSQFLAQQKAYLNLLETAQNADWSRVRVGISIAKWIKMPLGDTLQFTIRHNHRHILQALRVLESL